MPRTGIARLWSARWDRRAWCDRSNWICRRLTAEQRGFGESEMARRGGFTLLRILTRFSEYPPIIPAAASLASNQGPYNQLATLCPYGATADERADRPDRPRVEYVWRR